MLIQYETKIGFEIDTGFIADLVEDALMLEDEKLDNLNIEDMIWDVILCDDNTYAMCFYDEIKKDMPRIERVVRESLKDRGW